MKRTMALVLMLLMSAAIPEAFAASVSSAPIDVKCTVDGGLSLNFSMRKNDYNGALISSMNFGNLIEYPALSVLRSYPGSSTNTGAVDVFISANSHSLPYTITQTGTALSNGTTTIPAGACVVVPVYAAADNNGLPMPPGASLGTKGSWVATNKILYKSETGTAALRVLQMFYTITDDPASGATAAVPNTQMAGNYSGNVTFTVSA